jgi:putative addiction module antidote
MVTTIKLRKQGGSLAVTLPTEVVRKMGVRAGQALYLVETSPGEFRIAPYDPEMAAVLKAHEAVMDEYRDAFKALAE